MGFAMRGMAVATMEPRNYDCGVSLVVVVVHVREFDYRQCDASHVFPSHAMCGASLMVGCERQPPSLAHHQMYSWTRHVGLAGCIVTLPQYKHPCKSLGVISELCGAVNCLDMADK